MVLDAAWTRRWIDLAARDLVEAKELLTELDRAIGDADHGVNMERGFLAVQACLADTAPESLATPGEVLKLAAMTLLATVGGAAGPLYGTALLRAAKAVGTEELTATDVAQMIVAGATGIEERGKAKLGEKTMVDAWVPAAQAAEIAAAEPGASPQSVLAVAASAAEVGSIGTIDLLATKGRASYLGERSIGHEDPGARSSAIILQAASRAAQQGKEAAQ